MSARDVNAAIAAVNQRETQQRQQQMQRQELTSRVRMTVSRSWNVNPALLRFNVIGAFPYFVCLSPALALVLAFMPVQVGLTVGTLAFLMFVTEARAQPPKKAVERALEAIDRGCDKDAVMEAIVRTSNEKGRATKLAATLQQMTSAPEAHETGS